MIPFIQLSSPQLLQLRACRVRQRDSIPQGSTAAGKAHVGTRASVPIILLTFEQICSRELLKSELASGGTAQRVEARGGGVSNVSYISEGAKAELSFAHSSEC